MNSAARPRLYLRKKPLEYYDGILIRADPGLHEQVAHVIRQRVPLGSRVVDMGAGQGALAARLHDLGYKVTAVDVNDGDCAQQARAIDYHRVDFNAETQWADFIDAHAGCFDAVCGIEVIEHVENPWAYVRGLVRLARPGGTVVVSTPNSASWLSRLLFLHKGQFWSFEEPNLAYGHINPIAPFELKLILSRSGLTDVELTPAGTLPLIYAPTFAMALRSLLALPLRPLQRGMIDGWCVVASGTRADACC
ncbi:MULTISPECIES: class I SAM-dependent methyltransferase [Thiorhodovibrio]|uniref:class I SAM-dependent methyltransferase n=1 Tax=Thiorhodovibrio TaxID=61593 RepID=UPI001912BC4C|nr:MULTISPECIES: methyltransferase domain-containing protein [Thiorhodovibrio]WPL14629.1 3-demethylubiquinone-9 3-methyltransferase [Thiorhodovibrio litoralis]